MNRVIKKILAISSCFSVLFSTATFAAIPNKSVQSSFNTENLEEIIVSIPKRCDLEYSQTNNTYEKTDGVSAKGKISTNKQLSITTNTAIQYIFEDDENIKVNANVVFGTNGKSVWSAEEMRTNQTSDTPKDFKIVVNNADSLQYIGNYNATLNFVIALE